MIQVSPQIITAYPQDEIQLELVAKYPPLLWAWRTASAYPLNSDRSVQINNTNGAMRVGLQLRSGSGTAEWTLDAQSLPGASESIGFLIGVNAVGGSSGNILEIRFSSTQYKLYNDSGLIAGTTVTYAAVAGDRIKLEVYGSTIRVYFNDVLLYTQTYSSTNPYPVRTIAYVFAALAAHGSGNHFLPPVLTGDWQAGQEYNNFHVPATIGAFTLDAPRQIATVAVTGNPGTYNVTGVVGAGDTFTANATNNQLTVTGVLAVNDTVRVGLLPGGTLPVPLDFEQVYHVKTYSGGVITLSLTQGGAELDITSAGTGGWISRSNEVLLQYANAQVIVPPFDVIGIPADNDVDIQPSATRRFQTTYDGAQKYATTNYITRTVVTGGGGTFDASGLYTAPATAGTYTLRFESNSQRREFTVTVPLTMTPVTPAVEPGEAVTFTTTMGGTKTWSVTGGSLNTTSGATVIWTAPTVVGQITRVNVTNGTDVLYQDIPVLEVLPVPWRYDGYEFEAGGEVLAATAEDGYTVWSRPLTPVGIKQEELDITVTGLTAAEWETLRAFIEGDANKQGYFRTQKPYFIKNEFRYTRLAVRSISKVKGRVDGCTVSAAWKVARVQV